MCSGGNSIASIALELFTCIHMCMHIVMHACMRVCFYSYLFWLRSLCACVVYSLFVRYDCFAFAWGLCDRPYGRWCWRLWSYRRSSLTGHEPSVAVAICYRMDARVSIAGIRAISVVAKPSHVITVSLFNSACFTYITYYSIAYVTFLVCVCTMVLGFRNQLVSRQLIMELHDVASSVDSEVETTAGTDSEMPALITLTILRSRSDIFDKIPSCAAFEAKYELRRQKRRRGKSV